MAKSETDEFPGRPVISQFQANTFLDNTSSEKANSVTIHSGHFMISCIHGDDHQSDDDDNPDDSNSVKDLSEDPGISDDDPNFMSSPDEASVYKSQNSLRKKHSYNFDNANKSPQTSYQFGKRCSNHTAIDASLTKLFDCMTLAYSDNKLTSPKWKNFKGTKLPLKDKIRLNNIIWREWHMQYIQEKAAQICQFDPPISDKTHCKPEAVVLEGKYWKRKLDVVTSEYKKWRVYHKKQVVRKPQASNHVAVNQTQLSCNSYISPISFPDSGYHNPYDLDGQKLPHQKSSLAIYPGTSDPSGQSKVTAGFNTPHQDSCNEYLPNTDDNYVMDFSDTLFTTFINQPFTFPNPKEMLQLGNADIIQPGLVQLQPNIDDILMSNLSPLPPLPEMKSYRSDIDDSPGSIFNESPASILDLSPPSQLSLDGGGGGPPPPPPPPSTQQQQHHLLQQQQPQHIAPTGDSSSPLDLESLALQQQQQQHQQATASCSLFNDLEPESTLHLSTLQCTPTSAPSSSSSLNEPQTAPCPPSSSSSPTVASSSASHSSRGVLAPLQRMQSQPPQPLTMVHSNSQLQNLLQSFPQNRPLTLKQGTSVKFALPENRRASTGNQFVMPAPQKSTKGKRLIKKSGQSNDSYLGQLLRHTGAANYPQQHLHPQAQPQQQHLTSILPQPPAPSPASASHLHQPPHQHQILTHQSQQSIKPEPNIISLPKGVNRFQQNMLIAATSQAIGVPAQTINAVTDFSEESRSRHSSADSSVDLNYGNNLSVKHESSRISVCLSDKNKSSHLTAEKKRRCNIKSGFDSLHSLVPSLQSTASGKTSKASTLQKAIDYCKRLKSERKDIMDEINDLKSQVERLNHDISICQSTLPATGVPITRQRTDEMKLLLDSYIKNRTMSNWKFWIFSTILRPLFDTFNAMVSTSSADQLCRSTLSWLDQHCSLVALRPAVLNSLTRLSTTTSILSDPSLVPDQAHEAVRLLNT